MFNKFRGRDFEVHWKSFHMVKKCSEDRLHMNKMHLRHILVDRVMLHQEFRNESRSCTFTETHRQIILDLFELGVSRYSDVRVLAQAKLHSAVSHFPYSYTILTPRFREILKLDSIQHHEKFKGCLYILLGPRNSPIIARHDWKFVGEMWPLLVKSTPSEKPSIVNLINGLADAINRCFPTIAIKLCVPEKCLELAYNIGERAKINLDDFQGVVKSSGAKLDQKSVDNEETYNELMDQLLHACINGKL